MLNILVVVPLDSSVSREYGLPTYVFIRTAGLQWNYAENWLSHSN